MAEADTKRTSSVEFEQGSEALVTAKVTNGHMFKLYEQYKDTNYKIAVGKYLENFAVDRNLQELTVHNRLKLNYQHACSLRAKKREQYLEKEFSHPKSSAGFISNKVEDSPRKKELRKKLDNVKKQNTDLKIKLNDSYEELEKAGEENDKLCENYESIVNHLGEVENKYALAVNTIMEENSGDKLRSNELKEKLSLLETEYNEIKSDLDMAQEQLNKTKTKKLNKKIKQKEEKIIKKSKQLESSKRENIKAEKKLEMKNVELEDTKKILKSKESEIQKLKEEKQKLQKTNWYEGKKSKKYQETLNEEIENERAELDIKQKELEIREKELDYLQAVFENDVWKVYR